jgi:HAD superfamily hydrolase (TIGR01662 family)
MSIDIPIQAVFFDLGYTLINFEGDYKKVMEESYLVLAQSLRAAGYPVVAHEFAERFNHIINDYYRARDEDLIERPIEQYLAQVLASYEIYDPRKSLIQSALENMYRRTERHWTLDDNALSVLRTLKDAGFRLGMISNAANAENVNRLIDLFELRPYFEVIIISAIEGIRKPDTRIYSRALARLQVPAENTVMVGDTLTADIQGAQNAGLQAVWITRYANRPENQRLADSITPDAVIGSLSELPALLSATEA